MVTRTKHAPFRLTVIAAALVSQTAFGQVEEVIVTAEKRATTIQDTPIAVTAFTGDELDRALISKPLDMQFSVPNMLMSKGNFTTAQITIRGIGNLGVGAQTDSGTGMHFNGVYLNNGRIFETEFYDAERVEVLRGPQGTLYGRNTTAGVVNLITRKPDDKFGGDINLELGNYNHVKVKGAINFPMGDNFAQRFAMFYNKRDGYVDNLFDGDDIDGRDMYSIRSTTRWSNDTADATLTINYFEEDDDRMRGSNQQCLRDPEGIIGCLPTGLANQNPHGGATVTTALTGGLAPFGLDFPEDDYLNSPKSSDPRKQYLDFTPIYEVEDTMVSFEVNWDIGNLTLTSLTGYHESDLDARNDYDFTVASEQWPVEVTTQLGQDGSITTDRLYNTDRSSTSPEQWSQELRLASDFNGDWNFLVGGFYLTYESEIHYTVHSSALEVFGEYYEPILGTAPETRIFDNDTAIYELDTWAIFGELYWQTTDNISMILGLRTTEEEKKSRGRIVYLRFQDDPFAEGGGYSEQSGDWSEPTGKFNISWDASDDIMVYATLSTSYKSGGANPLGAENPVLDPDVGGDPALAVFEPEFINAIEFGAKAQFFDNTLQANMTYFYYDYEDLQISKIIAQTSLNENFDATIQGFEGEFVWVPDQHWRLTANLAWLDSAMDGGESIDPADINLLGTTENIISTPNANVYIGPGCPDGAASCPGLAKSLDGNQLPSSPEFWINLGIGYSWQLSSGMELVAATNYYWQDEFYTRVFNETNDTVDSWDVWNATLTLYSANQDWFAEAWGRNLKDDDHVTGQYLGDQNVGLPTNQFLLEPRTYGISLGYNF